MIDLKQLFEQLSRYAPVVANEFLENNGSNISALAGNGYDPVRLEEAFYYPHDANDMKALTSDVTHDALYNPIAWPSVNATGGTGTPDEIFALLDDESAKESLLDQIGAPAEYRAPSHPALDSAGAMLEADPNIGLPKKASRKEWWRPYREGWMS